MSIFWNMQYQYNGKIFSKATGKHFTYFAEWVHTTVYGSPGKPPGSCQVSS